MAKREFPADAKSADIRITGLICAFAMVYF